MAQTSVISEIRRGLSQIGTKYTAENLPGTEDLLEKVMSSSESLSFRAQPKTAPRPIGFPGGRVFPVPPKKALQLKENPAGRLFCLFSLVTHHNFASLLQPRKVAQQILIEIGHVCFEIPGHRANLVSFHALPIPIHQQTLILATHVSHKSHHLHALQIVSPALSEKFLHQRLILEAHVCHENFRRLAVQIFCHPLPKPVLQQMTQEGHVFFLDPHWWIYDHVLAKKVLQRIMTQESHVCSLNPRWWIYDHVLPNKGHTVRQNSEYCACFVTHPKI
jgi:hypothetical protein